MQSSNSWVATNTSAWAERSAFRITVRRTNDRESRTNCRVLLQVWIQMFAKSACSIKYLPKPYSFSAPPLMTSFTSSMKLMLIQSIWACILIIFNEIMWCSQVTAEWPQIQVPGQNEVHLELPYAERTTVKAEQTAECFYKFEFKCLRKVLAASNIFQNRTVFRLRRSWRHLLRQWN